MRTISVPTGATIDVIVEQGDWNTCVSRLRKHQQIPSPAAQLAYLRIQSGPTSELSTNGLWTSEAQFYHPNGEILAVMAADNPLLQYPRKATNAHARGEEYFLEERVYAALRKRASKDPSKASQSGVLLLERPPHNQEAIPVKDLPKHPYTRFIFESDASPYAAFLKNAGIASVPLYTVSADEAQQQSKPFARLLWVWGLVDDSGLSAGLYGLYGIGGQVFGVAQLPASAGLKASAREHRHTKSHSHRKK